MAEPKFDGTNLHNYSSPVEKSGGQSFKLIRIPITIVIHNQNTIKTLGYCRLSYCQSVTEQSSNQVNCGLAKLSLHVNVGDGTKLFPLLSGQTYCLRPGRDRDTFSPHMISCWDDKFGSFELNCKLVDPLKLMINFSYLPVVYQDSQGVRTHPYARLLNASASPLYGTSTTQKFDLVSVPVHISVCERLDEYYEPPGMLEKIRKNFTIQNFWSHPSDLSSSPVSHTSVIVVCQQSASLRFLSIHCTADKSCSAGFGYFETDSQQISTMWICCRFFDHLWGCVSSSCRSCTNAQIPIRAHDTNFGGFAAPVKIVWTCGFDIGSSLLVPLR